MIVLFMHAELICTESETSPSVRPDISKQLDICITQSIEESKLHNTINFYNVIINFLVIMSIEAILSLKDVHNMTLTVYGKSIIDITQYSDLDQQVHPAIYNYYYNALIFHILYYTYI